MARLRLEMKDLAAWEPVGSDSSNPLELQDYACLAGSLELFFGFSDLFDPPLVEHQGHWFLANGFSPTTYSDWSSRGLEIREIQKVMNHLHVSMVIQNQELSDFAAVEVARRLAAVWQRTLSPRKLEIMVEGEDYDTASVTFFGA